MKLSGERGGRRKRITATEALGGEQPERPVVSWPDLNQYSDEIQQLLKRLEVDPQAPGLEFQVVFETLEAIVFLQILCRLHPELCQVDPSVLAALAERAQNFGEFGVEHFFAGALSTDLRRELEATEVQKFQRAMQNIVTASVNKLNDSECEPIEVIFSVRLGAPALAKWFGVKKHLEQLMRGVKQEKNFLAGAELAVLYPDKRGEIVSFFSPSDWTEYKAQTSQYRRRVLSGQPWVGDSAGIAKDLFVQQVFSSADARFNAVGEVIITPPAKQLAPTPPLPNRPIL